MRGGSHFSFSVPRPIDLSITKQVGGSGIPLFRESLLLLFFFTSALDERGLVFELFLRSRDISGELPGRGVLVCMSRDMPFLVTDDEELLLAVKMFELPLIIVVLPTLRDLAGLFSVVTKLSVIDLIK